MVLQPVLSKGVPSLLGHYRSQQVTSTHITRAQKSHQHKTQMGKTLRSVSTSLRGTHREGGEDSRPRIFCWFTLETSAPENRVRVGEMKAVTFQDSPNLNFHEARLMLVPCATCSPPLTLKDDWAYKASSFSTRRDSRTAVTSDLHVDWLLLL